MVGLEGVCGYVAAAAYPAVRGCFSDFFGAFPVIAFVVVAVSASGFSGSILDRLAVLAAGAVSGECVAA